MMNSKFSNLSTKELVVVCFALILLGVAVLSFKAWLLGIVLQWFGVTLGFWKNLLIIVLLDAILASAKSSSNS